jgi:hypothetical protein
MLYDVKTNVSILKKMNIKKFIIFKKKRFYKIHFKKYKEKLYFFKSKTNAPIVNSKFGTNNFPEFGSN